jgi:hypothetical protein
MRSNYTLPSVAGMNRRTDIHKNITLDEQNCLAGVSGLTPAALAPKARACSKASMKSAAIAPPA